MLEPRAAIVRPRMMLSNSEGSMLLEDAIAARLEARRWGLIEIAGSAGSGKSTALAHLAHVFIGDSRVVVHDEPDELDMMRLEIAATKGIALVAEPVYREVESSDVPQAETWALARWLRDDLIEYLLAAHREQCASVIARVQRADTPHRLGGTPELWCLALEHMVADESIREPLDALRAALHSCSIDRGQLNAYRTHCFARLMNPAVALLHEVSNLHDQLYERLVRHDVVQSILAAEHVVRRLQGSIPVDVLARRLPARLVKEIGVQLRGNRAAIVHLQRAANGADRSVHSMAISLLHAGGANWRPADDSAPLLAGAHLAGLRWPGVRLAQLSVSDANLTGADLSEAQILGMIAFRALLARASLRGASIKDLSARDAKLERADLSFLRAPEAILSDANLVEALLEGALLSQAAFDGADLSGARLCRADLWRSNFSGATVAGADFTGANLADCNLRGLNLRETQLAGAILNGAILDKCDLSEVALPGASLESASLVDADLTGTYMPGAKMHRAILVGTRLADISWEGADLRDANFDDSTFHMGSSRSGLVGSPLASEGTRTGFYTDEYTEQGFKAPEEIRKANLCRADLRGAKVEKVDFYLVDLRGALYSPEQEVHFQRCKAILGAYV